jgi:hypothetical protein
MDGAPILKGDYAQYTTFQFIHNTPETVAVKLLGFGSNGIQKYPDAPFLLKVGPSYQNHLLKVVCKPELFDHLSGSASTVQCHGDY